MASLTDPKVTGYSTVSSVDADLVEAEAAYEGLQDELMTLLEGGGATMAKVAELEARVAAALYTRDDLRSTRHFLVDRQRWQVERDAEGFMYSIVLCKWAETFKATDVAEYTFNLHAANETNGVTGAIYVLRGWFAIYLEGSPQIINRMCAEMKANRAQFELVVVAEKDMVRPTKIVPSSSDVMRGEHRNSSVTSSALTTTDADVSATHNIIGNRMIAKRRYSTESLRIIHVEDAQSTIQKHPEATVLREIAYMMNLFSFVPEFNEANRGKGRFETTKGANMLVKNDPTAHGGVFPTTTRIVALLSPFGDFWEAGLLDTDMSRIIRNVYRTAQSFLVDRDQHSFLAGLSGPHTQDGLHIVIDSANIHYVLEVMTDFLAELTKDVEIAELYKPLLVLEHCSDVGLVVNGSCTVVGPVMRQLRKLMTCARLEAVPFLTSYRIADMANRSGCHSVGVFVIDKDPAELFTHVTQLGKLGLYNKEAERLSSTEQSQQDAVNRHVEGPGAIEPCTTLGIHEASEKEKLQLTATQAHAERQSRYKKQSGTYTPSPYFSTGTMDSMPPPSTLGSTRAMMAALKDPTSGAGLKSIKELTTSYKGHPVMVDDASVKPAGSALHAVRSVTAAAAAANPLNKSASLVGASRDLTIVDGSTADGTGLSKLSIGAQAAKVVQSVQYFAPKGIQGDEEFRAIYEELPQKEIILQHGGFGKPDVTKSYATRRGFDLYYYSLEHYGSVPTPAMVDELLGKTKDPELVTFEQFCMVMHKYQRM